MGSNVKISNVSFIIISRNEEFVLEKCLNSIKKLDLNNCQVVCVNSGSTDNTQGIMENYSTITTDFCIFRIDGESNAAVARNVGIRNASKEFVFFLDGDVEVRGRFIETALRCIRNGKCIAVTGQLEEYQYTSGFRKLIKKITDRYGIKNEGIRYFSGGIFICKRSIVSKIGLFDETLVKSQDIDYTLRLSRFYTMYEIPVSMGIHHTVPYENSQRIYLSLKDQHAAYIGRCYRKNIRNIKGILSLFVSYSGNSIGLMFYSISIFLFFVMKSALFYVSLVPFLDTVYGVVRKRDLHYRLLSHYIFPLFTIKGFVFFNKKQPVYSVKKIK